MPKQTFPRWKENGLWKQFLNLVDFWTVCLLSKTLFLPVRLVNTHGCTVQKHYSIFPTMSAMQLMFSPELQTDPLWENVLLTLNTTDVTDCNDTRYQTDTINNVIILSHTFFPSIFYWVQLTFGLPATLILVPGPTWGKGSGFAKRCIGAALLGSDQFTLEFIMSVTRNPNIKFTRRTEEKRPTGHSRML